MTKKNYDLNFIDAIQACLIGGGFIRGNDFDKGLYVKADKGQLIIVDGNDLHGKLMDLYINHGLMNQKWKLFHVANQTELND